MYVNIYIYKHACRAYMNIVQPQLCLCKNKLMANGTHTHTHLTYTHAYTHIPSWGTSPLSGVSPALGIYMSWPGSLADWMRTHSFPSASLCIMYMFVCMPIYTHRRNITYSVIIVFITLQNQSASSQMTIETFATSLQLSSVQFICLYVCLYIYIHTHTYMSCH
jgi:hypothetical protein